MNDTYLFDWSQDAIKYLLSLGIPSIVGLVIFVLGAAGLEKAIERARFAARTLRTYVDEPTDPMVMLAEKLGEAIIQRDVDPALVSTLLTELMDHFAAPPQEVALPSAKGETSI
jgi:hypothetical protein